jgi:hypothetical protein
MPNPTSAPLVACSHTRPSPSHNGCRPKPDHAIPIPLYSHATHGSRQTHPHSCLPLRYTSTIRASLRTAATTHFAVAKPILCAKRTHTATPTACAPLVVSPLTQSLVVDK